MELTHKQSEAVKLAVQRYKHLEPYTVLAGVSGSGKSTIIKFIVDALNLKPEDVAYIAYTGRAAQILRSKGCEGAMTAHKLLYKSVQLKDGTFKHIPKYISPTKYKLIVVDEVSMLPQKMWDLLLSHHIPVLAVGDPAQLPPVAGNTDVLDRPHIFLDEIMRTEDSEIVRLSTAVREGKQLKPYKGQSINIVKSSDFVEEMLPWADQVLCGRNITRNSLNDTFRRMKWGPQMVNQPLVGDKIICLKNNWDIINDNEDALVNGTIGFISDIKTEPNPYLGTYAKINFTPEGTDKFNNILIDWKLITQHIPTVTKENFASFPRRLRPELFDYGYCITVHKAQGGEFDKVLVIEEKMRLEDHQRWLYTAITRAVHKLTLVLQ